MAAPFQYVSCDRFAKCVGCLLYTSGAFNLIPVAVVRDIRQAIPVSGNFVGMTDAFADMSVEVLVTS